MKFHDLTSEDFFENLPIPLPEKLETDEDYALLFHYMISEYHLAINTYQREYGYPDRQRLLVSISMLLSDGLPQIDPDYVKNFPDSLEDIKMAVAKMLLLSTQFAGHHPDGE